MTTRPLGRIKEKIAADKLSDATGQAMSATIYQIRKTPDGIKGRNLDAREAARISALVSLGKKTILFRHANRTEERQGAIDELTAMLMRETYKDGRRKFIFPLRDVKCIAGTALQELAHDKCPACRGAGQIRLQRNLEGAQPMLTCPECQGRTTLKTPLEDERIRSLATQFMSYLDIVEGQEAEALRVTTKEIRKHPKLGAMLTAIDYARGRLLEAERVATEETARMLDGWRE